MAQYEDFQPEIDTVPGLSQERFQGLVKKESERYPEHAVLAASLAKWVAVLRDDDEMRRDMDPKELRGYQHALQAVSDFLFQGAYLPGGQRRLAEPADTSRPSAEDRAPVLEQFEAGEGRHSAD